MGANVETGANNREKEDGDPGEGGSPETGGRARCPSEIDQVII